MKELALIERPEKNLVVMVNKHKTRRAWGRALTDLDSVRAI